MSLEENKAVVRRLYMELFNKGRTELIDELYAPDYVSHTAAPAARQDRGQVATRLRTTFPDLHVTIEDLLAEGDKVMSRVTIRGTDTGGFQGRPPTGRRIEIAAMVVRRIVDGKIAEAWELSDQAGLQRQLGLTPAPTPGRG
jgi:steroid delta-isomerase-like uncharacterized protein